MRKIYYELDIGAVGCGDEGVTTVDDDMTDSQIDDMVNQMAHDWADSWEGDERLGFTSPDDEEYSEELAVQEAEEFRANVGGWWRDATPEEIEDYA